MSALTRRSLLVATAALGATALAGPAVARFEGGQFSSVIVDVDPLLARGLGSFAEFLRTALVAEMQRAFADRLGGSGPILVVRITGVSMNMYAGHGGGGRKSNTGGGSDNDYLEGEALIIDRSGQILARHPQLSVVPASSGGAWYDPASEPRRVVAMAQHYAGWLRRAI